MMCKNKINIGEKTILFKNESFLNNLHFYLNEMLAPPPTPILLKLLTLLFTQLQTSTNYLGFYIKKSKNFLQLF